MNYDARLDRLTQDAVKTIEGETPESFTENNILFLSDLSGIHIEELKQMSSNQINEICENNR